MNDILRERLIRKLGTLPEERVYQILDYIDFLESKYAPQISASPNPIKRFAEGVEDTLRARKAAAVVSGVASVGKSVATEIAGVASSVTGIGSHPGEPEPAVSTGAPPSGT